MAPAASCNPWCRLELREKGEIGAEVLHRDDLIAAELRVNIPSAVLQYKLPFGQRECNGDRPTDRRVLQPQHAVLHRQTVSARHMDVGRSDP